MTKKLFGLLAALGFAVSAFGQTAEEIVQRMDAAMRQYQHEKGMCMTVDIKIPILGTMSSKVWSFEEKMRMEVDAAGSRVITWMDEKTEWTYDSDKNELTIENRKADEKSGSGGDAEMFQDITDGYDVSIKKETADSWQILCKKSKNNKEKDDPNTMDLVVSKADYSPKSLSANLKGITMTMRDLRYDVTEKDAAFNPDEFPGATVIDKR